LEIKYEDFTQRRRVHAETQ